ncbi:MAG: UDP-N-acetylmuramate--L-alanine ligase [Burkholderiales bacterium]
MKHKVKHVHFVGIGGAGMSGIAEVMLNLGFAISGSDVHDTAVTKRLRQLGASIAISHHAKNIEGANVLVVSSAISPDNVEVSAARERAIPVVPRAIMLAELMRLRQGIAIAGTHGKTTTTSLVASVLRDGGLDPTFVIGGRLEQAGAHAKLGSGEFLVAEADESDASFLHLNPVIGVVTNIDSDHMEFYGHDFDKLKKTFIEFVERLPFYGMAILCADDAHARSLIPSITKPVTTYGVSAEAKIRATNVHHDGTRMRFTLAGSREEIALNLPGVHNVQNALAAIAVGLELSIPFPLIAKALAEFEGVGRRFQHHGTIAIEGGAFTLIDDYGHHPTEIAATLAAARAAYPGRRLVLAFQPHRYTRTRDLFEDFVKVLAMADALLLAEVYPAGETPIVAADGRSLARAIRIAGRVEPIFVEDIAELPVAIREHARDGDLVVTMGAGSISRASTVLCEGREPKR